MLTFRGGRLIARKHVRTWHTQQLHLRSVFRVSPSVCVCVFFNYNLLSLHLSAAACRQHCRALHKSCLGLKFEVARSLTLKAYFWKQFQGGGGKKKKTLNLSMLDLTAALHPL